MADFLIQLWDTIGQMAPYLLLGFLISGLLSIWLSPAFVRNHLGSRHWTSVFKAALFGVPLPLCSCGVIPVSMSLHQQGASKAATLAFLLSTPQTGVDSILVTYSLLGPVVAIVRPIAAFITGIFGGFLITLAEPAATSKGSNPSETACNSKSQNINRWGKLGKALHYGFVALPADIAPAMLTGILIAAAIAVWVPDDFFAGALAGGGGVMAMLAMMALGVPMYVCATASVPIALALVEKGISPGAAMVFLITGPATNAAGLATLWSALGWRAAICYLASVVLCAFATGFLLDWVLSLSPFQHTLPHTHPNDAAGWATHLFSLALMAVLLLGTWQKWRRKKAA